jgi:hypothetical protein
MAEYDDAKTYWETTRGSEIDQDRYPPLMSIPVAAPTFMDQLFELAWATQDVRFVEAAKAIQEHNLVDRRGAWRRDTPSFPLDFRKLMEGRAADLVNLMLKDGCSLRTALARTVVICRWHGNSFTAATKHVERIWRSRRNGPTGADEIKIARAQLALMRRRMRKVIEGFFWYFLLREEKPYESAPFVKEAEATARSYQARFRKFARNYSLSRLTRRTSRAGAKQTRRRSP